MDFSQVFGFDSYNPNGKYLNLDSYLPIRKVDFVRLQIAYFKNIQIGSHNEPQKRKSFKWMLNFHNFHFR